MNKLTVAACAALLVVGIAAAHLWRELRDERAQTNLLQTRVIDLEASLAATRFALPVPPPAAETTAVVENAGATANDEPPAAPAAPVANRPVRAAVADVIQQTLATPAGRDMLRSLARNALPRQYPDLGKELGLTPEEVDEFFDLLTSQQLGLADDSLGLLAGGAAQDPAARQEAQRRLLEKQSANEAELAAKLGSKYPKWQEYQGTRATRQQVDRLRSTLATGNDALSEAQTQPLVTALAAEQARIDQETREWERTAARSSSNMVEDQLQRMSENNQRLVNVASSHLNTRQLEQYRRMLDQNATMARSVAGMMGGQGAARGDREPAAPVQ